MTFDAIIRHATLLDGTGAPPVPADLAVSRDRIAAVGDLSAAAAPLEIDAAGLVLCPGFIDAHSHSDAYILLQPAAESKIRQGVTTEIVGNCGASAAPLLPGYAMPSDWLEHLPRPGWTTLATYRACLDAARPALNIAMLVGHRTLRAAVMGAAPRAATPDEIRAMCRLLDAAMEEGALGLSSGLVYAPAMFAEPAEIHALAAVAARHGGIYASHIRSESAHLLEAIDEFLDAGRATGVRLQLSHFKTSGRPNWHKLPDAVGRIEAARASGLDLASDRYPYTASSTDLDILLPVWAEQGGCGAILARLRDPATRAKIRAEILEEHPDPDYWTTVRIGATHAPENAPFAGRPLPAVAEALRLHPLDAALRLMDTDDLHTGGIFFGMSEDNMWTILSQPWVAIGSDASLRAPWGPLSTDHPHPRAYGTFARFLRASLDGRTVPLPEAVRKMTSLPAGRFRLADRGTIRPGAFADLVLFDPAAVRDTATYAAPHAFAAGIRAVFVNGAPAWRAPADPSAPPAPDPAAPRAGRFLAPGVP